MQNAEALRTCQKQLGRMKVLYIMTLNAIDDACTHVTSLPVGAWDGTCRVLRAAHVTPHQLRQ